MLQVKQVVNRVFTSNTYIVFDEDFDDCWLVDVGDYERVLAAIPNKKNIKGLFLTHTHFDHIYGINDLCEHYPNCTVYTSTFGSEALMDDRKNLSRYHEHPIIFKGKYLKVVDDGDEIPLLCNSKIKAVATPGHDPGCLSFMVDNFIFTGDSFIPNLNVVTKLPRGNRCQAIESVKKILCFAKNKIICPGHGDIYYEGTRL